jgi:ornithine--oxo-acid transaminase
MSIVMGQAYVMDVLDRHEVASTFAAPPVACAAALAALSILETENISARAQRLGELLTKTLDELASPYVLEHRGRERGLFQCLVIDETTPGVTGRRVAALCARRGLLVGNSANRLRFSPPLTISEEDLLKGAKIVDQALRDVATQGDIPGGEYIN